MCSTTSVCSILPVRIYSTNCVCRGHKILQQNLSPCPHTFLYSYHQGGDTEASMGPKHTRNTSAFSCYLTELKNIMCTVFTRLPTEHCTAHHIALAVLYSTNSGPRCTLFPRSVKHTPLSLHMMYEKAVFIRPSYLLPLLHGPILICPVAGWSNIGTLKSLQLT